MKLVKDRKLRLIDEVELQLYEEDNKYYADAEDLHDWLQVKTYFTTWMKQRISKYEINENEDFKVYYCKDLNNLNILNDKNVKSVENTRRENLTDFKKLSDFTNEKQASKLGYKKKYFLLPETVKHLAMVEDVKKGKLVREYYIQLEKYIQQTKQEELFRAWRIKDSENRRLLHEEIGSDTDCIRLSMTINYLVSYMRDLPTVLKKDEFYRNYVKDRDKESWPLYLDVQEKAVEFYHTYMAIGTLNPVLETCKLLIGYYVGNEDKYREYIKNKKSLNK